MVKFGHHFCLKILTLKIFSLCDKLLPGEIIHIKVCKLILGVHRKATNNAVRGELGSYPLLITMLCLSIKYWWKLNKNCLDGCDSLAVHALLDNRRICSTGISSWSTGLKNIFTLVDGLEIWDKPNIFLLMEVFSLRFNLIMIIFGFIRLTVVRQSLGHTAYLKKNLHLKIILRRSITANFSRLRVSAHSLMIEKGRHFRKKIPIENRLCTLLNLNETEDEAHFMPGILCLDMLDVLTTLILERRCFLI